MGGFKVAGEGPFWGRFHTTIIARKEAIQGFINGLTPSTIVRVLGLEAFLDTVHCQCYDSFWLR